jgi:hypothetical protein
MQPSAHYHSNIPPNYLRPPTQPYAFPPGLTPSPIPQFAAFHPGPPLEKFIHDAVFLAFKQNISSQGLSGCTRQNGLQPLESGDRSLMSRPSNAPSGISREEAKALFSTFCSDVKASIQEQSSRSLKALEEHKASSDVRATSCDATAQSLEQVLRSIEALRQEVQTLSATLDSKVNAVVQEESSELRTALSEYEKLTDTTMARWSATAGIFEQILQSAESFAESFKSGVAQDHAKHCSEMEALLAKQISAMYSSPPRLGIGENASPVLQEMKDLLHELQNKVKDADLRKSKRSHSQTSSVDPLHPPRTRQQTRASRQTKQKGPSTATRKSGRVAKR